MKINVNMYWLTIKVKGFKPNFNWSAMGPDPETAQKRAKRRIKEELDLFNLKDDDIEIVDCEFYANAEIDGYDP